MERKPCNRHEKQRNNVITNEVDDERCDDISLHHGNIGRPRNMKNTRAQQPNKWKKVVKVFVKAEMNKINRNSLQKKNTQYKTLS